MVYDPSTTPNLRTAEGVTRLANSSTNEDTNTSPIREIIFAPDCPHSDMTIGRNLVLNVDGTANQFNRRTQSTNVVEFFSRLFKLENRQLVYYDSGIGTYARPSFQSLSYLKQKVVHTIDTAIAWNFEQIILAAYKWLSENYLPGDRIFLFGFSRGAYQVRVIAGMIEKVGLLHKGNERQIPFAYELYSSVMDNTSRAPVVASDTVNPKNIQQSEEDELCASFKRSLCHEGVKVHFVGAWDTVSSVGVFRGKTLPETVSGMVHVCHFRHALALDERRAKFQPEYVNGGLGPNPGQRGDVKEVWFAGSHSDIGGGNTLNKKLANFGPALRWMTYEAMLHGLLMKNYEGEWSSLKPTDSLTWVWKLFEYLPFGALSYTDENSLTWWPHLSAARVIQPGQRIHQSVFSTLVNTSPALPDDALSTKVHKVGESYTPTARFSDQLAPLTWASLFACHSEDPNNIIEKDPFEDVSHTLKDLDAACQKSVETIEAIDLSKFRAPLSVLIRLLNDATRLPSFTEVSAAGPILLRALQFSYQHEKANTEARRSLFRLLACARPIPGGEPREFRTVQIRQWVVENALSDAQLRKVLRSFGDGHIMSRLMDRHLEPIKGGLVSARFSANNQLRVTMGSSTGLYTYVWVTYPNPQVEDEKHLAGNCSAISRDGSYIAVAMQDQIGILRSVDDALQIIDDKQDENDIEDGEISCLCFYNDRRMLASGHRNGRIKVWNGAASSWRVVDRFKAAREQIHALVFSDDGSKVAFISAPGNSIRVLDTDDGRVFDLGNSHHSYVLAWFGSCIAAGDLHGTVRIWIADQGDEPKILKAHGEDTRINAIAFRHDGKVLATGGSDGRIRVWNRETLENVWRLNIGAPVHSIAFSSDGNQLVSGGIEGEVHIWDVATGCLT
ncbi:hypothetical protein ONZ45_g12631 [Pleurotus djamor]|nr:hypothetical protein ONZ45_g12631 [Pleurotus djamor]